MKLSDLDPKAVRLVQMADPQEQESAPLRLSDLSPEHVTLVEHAPAPSESAARSFVSSMGAGLADEAAGAVGAVGRLVGVKNAGSAEPFKDKYETTDEPLSLDAIVQAYRDNRDAVRAKEKQDMEINPGSTIAGGLAGALVSPVNKIIAPQRIGPLTKAGGLLQDAKTAALQSAAYGAGMSDADLTKGEAGKFGKDVLLSAGIGAATPYVLKGAGAATGLIADKGADLAKWAGKKSLSNLGVSVQNIEKYWANPERINNAKSFGEMKDMVDEAVGNLRDAVEQGKATEAEAKESLRAMRDHVTTALQDKKIDSRDAVRRADDMFKDARAQALEPLKSKTAPTGRASDVVQAVEDLKQKVVQGSNDALEVLEKTGKPISTRFLKGEVSKAMNGLKIGGSEGGVVGEQSSAALGSLQKLRDQLDSLPDTISPTQLKSIVKGLDRDISWTSGAGEFMDPASQEKLGIRRGADAFLKRHSPEYEKAMIPVAEDAQLLDQVRKPFKNESAAISQLGQVAGPKGQLVREPLEKLGEKTGRNFVGDIDEYTRVQKILKDPQAVRQIEQSLPEYDALRRAELDLYRRNPKWTREQIERATAPQQRALDEAMGRRISAEVKLAPYKGLTPASTEAKLNSVMNGEKSNINNRKVLERLGSDTGHDYLQMADDLGVKNAFEKGNTNGSRNTLFYGLIGAMVGGLPGAAAGATFGHQVVDKYGPKVAKGIMDGMMKIRDNPSVQTIRSLSVPQSVKDDLEREFRVYLNMRNSEGSAAPKIADTGQEQREPAAQLKGEALWMQKGADKLGLSSDDIAGLSKSQRQLLIEASDLPAGSKKLQSIMNKINQGRGK